MWRVKYQVMTVLVTLRPLPIKLFIFYLPLAKSLLNFYKICQVPLYGRKWEVKADPVQACTPGHLCLFFRKSFRVEGFFPSCALYSFLFLYSCLSCRCFVEKPKTVWCGGVCSPKKKMDSKWIKLFCVGGGLFKCIGRIHCLDLLSWNIGLSMRKFALCIRGMGGT